MAAYHAAQLLLDEAPGMAVSLHAFRRGTLLLATDGAYMLALGSAPAVHTALQQRGGHSRLAWQVAGVAAANAAVFHLFFADSASFKMI